MGNKNNPLKPNPISLLLLLLCGILNIISVRRMAKYLRQSSHDHAVYSYRGHDFPPYFPMPTPIGETFMRVGDLGRFPVAGAASDKAWVSLAGKSFGYVRLGPVEEAQKVQPLMSEINSTKSFEPRRMLVITSFHELHCLRMLNAAFEKEWAAAEAHIKHCLGYLRNGILCDSDLTPEPAGWEKRFSSEMNSDEEKGGMTHVCRDWAQIYRAVHENWKQWHSGERLD